MKSYDVLDVENLRIEVQANTALRVEAAKAAIADEPDAAVKHNQVVPVGTDYTSAPKKESAAATAATKSEHLIPAVPAVDLAVAVDTESGQAGLVPEEAADRLDEAAVTDPESTEATAEITEPDTAAGQSGQHNVYSDEDTGTYS